MGNQEKRFLDAINIDRYDGATRTGWKSTGETKRRGNSASGLLSKNAPLRFWRVSPPSAN